jgi:hypothetical protein
MHSLVWPPMKIEFTLPEGFNIKSLSMSAPYSKTGLRHFMVYVSKDGRPSHEFGGGNGYVLQDAVDQAVATYNEHKFEQPLAAKVPSRLAGLQLNLKGLNLG